MLTQSSALSQVLQMLLDAQQTNPDAVRKHPFYLSLSKAQQQEVEAECARLQQPCKTIIDMRHTNLEEVQEYKVAYLTHYMTPEIKERFDTEHMRFGLYTVGVFESIDTLIQELVLGLADARELAEFITPTFKFLDFAQRNAERMHLSIPLVIYRSDGKKIHARSIDVSISGLQFKYEGSPLLNDGEIIDVVFSGLEEQSTHFSNMPIRFTVLKGVRQGVTKKIFCNRSQLQEDPDFNEFLTKFIRGNKYRYKLNIDNTINALENKMCEQFFTPKFPSLPVFISHEHGELIPKYAMLNHANDQLMSYWYDENHQQRLGDLVSQSRLAELQKQQGQDASIYVYTFNHVSKGKVFFYSASQSELNKNGKIRDVFLRIGSHKASWRVFKLQLTDASPSDVHTPLSIADYAHKNAKELNTPPPARLMAKLKNIRHIVVISDVTDKHGQLFYQHTQITNSNSKTISEFAHSHKNLPPQIEITRHKNEDIRHETRYFLRSAITVEVAGKLIKGHTEDFSVSGIRLELNEALPYTEDMQIKVSFPKLQELTTNHSLERLTYNIVSMHTNRHILHLRISPFGKKSESARAFFNHLISKNKDKLKAEKIEESVQGLCYALRCLYAKNATNVAFFINRNNSFSAPEFSIYNQGEGRLFSFLSMFAEKDFFNWEFLYRDRHQISPFIQKCLRNFRDTEIEQQHTIYIAFDLAATNINKAIKPVLNEHFKDDNQRLYFIRKAQEYGNFIAVQLVLQPTANVDFDTLQVELEYLASHSKHKATLFKTQLESMKAFGYVLDVTDEIMYRYGLVEQALQADQHLAG